MGLEVGGGEDGHQGAVPVAWMPLTRWLVEVVYRVVGLRGRLRWSG